MNDTLPFPKSVKRDDCSIRAACQGFTASILAIINLRNGLQCVQWMRETIILQKDDDAGEKIPVEIDEM